MDRSRHSGSSVLREQALTAAVRGMILGSPRLTALAGGERTVHRMLECIENVWLDYADLRIHFSNSRRPVKVSVHQGFPLVFS
jgi:hypothetical protein